MCVSGVGVDARGDRDDVGEVVAVVGRPVTARSASLFVRTSSPRRSESRGSEPLSLQRRSSRLVPSAPAATTTPRARSACAARGEPGARALARRPRSRREPSPAPSGRTSIDRALGLDLDAALLGEPEVVLDERVLRAVAAADHAGAAADAARARRAPRRRSTGRGRSCPARRRTRRRVGRRVGVADAQLARRPRGAAGRRRSSTGSSVDAEHALGRRRSAARARAPSRASSRHCGRLEERARRARRACSRSRGCRRRRRSRERSTTSLNSVSRRIPCSPSCGTQK